MSISTRELADMASNRFDALKHKRFHWRSFYNGYLEGYMKAFMDQKKEKEGES